MSDRTKSSGRQILVITSDFFFVAVVFLWTVSALRLAPTFGLGIFIALIVEALTLVGIGKYFLHTTFGEWIWERDWLRTGNRFANDFSAMFLTIGLVFFACLFFKQAVLKYPVWRTAETWKLEAFTPEFEPSNQNTASNKQWTVGAFFYSLGAWPAQFKGHPVFYSLPYAKGPPAVFLESLVARWDMPRIYATLEGPKTPEHWDREVWAKCLRSPPEFFGDWSCWRKRKAAIERHVQEMERKLGPVSRSNWELKWFSVENRFVDPSLELQGFFIGAQNATQAELRFVAISTHGIQQAFILDYPLNSDGEKARELFEKSIRSLRFFDEIESNRAWADRNLEQLKMPELNQPQLKMAEFTAKIAEIQSLLLSKVSVDPQTIEAYFHLGGTSLLLFKRAKSEPQTPDNAALTSVAAQMLGSVYRYAQDISPTDPAAVRLQGFYLETK